MKLTTKTVASLLVVTAVAAAVPGLSQITIPKKRRESQFDKLLSRHDRKASYVPKSSAFHHTNSNK